MKTALLAFAFCLSAFAADDPFGPSFAKTYEDIKATFEGLTEANPDVLKKKLLIRTPEGRDLAIYTAGNEASGKRSLLLCNHHGDEQWVAQLCVDFAKYLMWAKNTDPIVSAILKDSALDILPLGNPDGFSRASRFNGNNVDINRNFPFKWGYIEPGTVNPNPGPYALSELETIALHDYQQKYRKEWVAIFNYHLRYPNSDGKNYILLPWAYTKKQTLTPEQMARYTPFLPSKQEAPTFIVDTVPNVFYPCSGTHTDWSYVDSGAPSFVMELGHGYNLPSRETYLTRHLKKENLPVFLRFLKGVRASLSK